MYIMSHALWNGLNPSKWQILDPSFYWKSLQMTILNLIKMVENSLKGEKTLWEKEKLLIMSNFFFSHGVFIRLVL